MPSSPTNGDRRRRKALGAWYTPREVVERLVDQVVSEDWIDRRACRRDPIRVIDPACGDGRFLAAAGERLARRGAAHELIGIDVDPDAVALARRTVPSARITLDDALRRTWSHTDRGGFDAILGNPPFLTPLSASNDVERRYGGPLADAAAEFLGLSSDLVALDGGRIGLVLPQSILAARDAGPVRRRIDEMADIIWSALGSTDDFDAQVNTCSIVFDTNRPARSNRRSWSALATNGVPPLVPLATDGTLGDRARLVVGFRSEYYGLVPAVGDDVDGPALITSGLIDPGVSWWGQRPVRFDRRRFEHPRVDLDRLDGRLRRWATERLTPKVLIANQTSIVEAVADLDGDWLPAVPVIAAHPYGASSVDEIAAMLTSPIASASLWHRNGGTGLSSTAVRVSPSALRDLPWPTGDLGAAAEALRSGDIDGCASAVIDAYGVAPGEADALFTWWSSSCDRIAQRSAAARGHHESAGARPAVAAP